jgi:hypothetical protein
LQRNSKGLIEVRYSWCAKRAKAAVSMAGWRVMSKLHLTLFHCHQQLHMDFGFMTLFDYVAGS